MVLDGLRNEDSPPLRADRLAAGEAISMLPKKRCLFPFGPITPLSQRPHVRRLRDRIGDLAGVLIITGLVWACLWVLTCL